MTFKWSTRLPTHSHKIKSEDFEVSNRIYRIVMAAVAHITPQIVGINRGIIERGSLSGTNTNKTTPTGPDIVHFTCLCGKGCKREKRGNIYFIGIEYRGNSHTPIAVRINIRLEGKQNIKTTMICSLSKYDDYYGEYYDIPCKDHSNEDRQKVTISLLITPYRQALIGIRNLGATCYINSLIQVLYWNNEFFKRIMRFDVFSQKRGCRRISQDGNSSSGYIRGDSSRECENTNGDSSKDCNIRDSSKNGHTAYSTANLLRKETRYQNIRSLQALFYLLTPPASSLVNPIAPEPSILIDPYTAGNTSNCQEIPPLPYSTNFSPSPHMNFSLLGPIHEHQDVHEWYKLLMDRLERELKEYLMENKECTNGEQNIQPELNQSQVETNGKHPHSELNTTEPETVTKISELNTVKPELNKECGEQMDIRISKSVNKDYFNEIFDGKMVHIIQSACGCVSKREETFSEIELDFFDCSNECPFNEHMCDIPHFINNLQHSLRHHFSKETLVTPNQYFCETHNSHHDALKYLRIRKLPCNLVFIIKRFNMNWETMEVEKCDREMVYTEHVDMAEYMDNSDYNESVLSEGFDYQSVVHNHADLNKQSNDHSESNNLERTNNPEQCNTNPQANGCVESNNTKKVNTSEHTNEYVELNNSGQFKTPNTFANNPYTIENDSLHNNNLMHKNINKHAMYDNNYSGHSHGYVLMLNSVIVHQGIPTDGHYYSYTRLSGTFHKFNDSQVTPATSSEIFLQQNGGRHPYKALRNEHSAYLLYYGTMGSNSASNNVNSIGLRSNYHTEVNGNSTRSNYHTDVNGDSTRSNYHTDVNGDSTRSNYHTGVNADSTRNNYHTGVNPDSTNNQHINNTHNITGNNTTNNPPSNDISTLNKSLIELYTLRHKSFPRSLISYFSHFSIKLCCTDPHRLVGYDGPGPFNYSYRYPRNRTVQMSMEELQQLVTHKKNHYIFGIVRSTRDNTCSMDDSTRINTGICNEGNSASTNTGIANDNRFKNNEASNIAYTLSTRLNTDRIFSYYTNECYDWSTTPLFIIKKYTEPVIPYHSYCNVYPYGSIKVIGVDVQVRTWTEGYDVYVENDYSTKTGYIRGHSIKTISGCLCDNNSCTNTGCISGNSTRTNTASGNTKTNTANTKTTTDCNVKVIILHKNQSDQIHSLLSFIHQRGLIRFRNNNKIIELFIQRDDSWRDKLGEYLRSEEIRVRDGKGYIVDSNYQEHNTFKQDSTRNYDTRDGSDMFRPISYTEETEPSIVDFYIPPHTMLLTVAHGCLDYNKINHFHTVLVERENTVKHLIERMRMKRVCIFNEHIRNGTPTFNTLSATPHINTDNGIPQYIMVKLQKNTLNIAIYRESDMITNCAPDDVFILQSISPSWTDYVVIAYMKGEEIVGYPFLVYWNREEIIGGYRGSSNRYAGYNYHSYLGCPVEAVTWNMLKLKYNITDKILIVQDDMMRQVDGEEVVITGSICVLISN